MQSLASGLLIERPAILKAPGEGRTGGPVQRSARPAILKTPGEGRAGGLVQRSALFERLSTASAGVLICGPAGSGKTVLLRSWVEAAGLQDRLAWVSVRRGERDSQQFWLLVIGALAGAVSGIHGMDPSPSFHGEAVVEQLLVDLEGLENRAVLVIDDLARTLFGGCADVA